MAFGGDRINSFMPSDNARTPARPLSHIIRQIAPRRADDLPFLFGDVVVRAPLLNLAGKPHDLLLVARRPPQHTFEDFFEPVA
jgi:hypothetical protein